MDSITLEIGVANSIDGYMVTARIPNPHHGEEIDPSLLDTVLDEAGISREEWFSVA